MSRLSSLARGLSCARACSTAAERPLYETHVRVSPLQRGALALGSAFGALAWPERADLVAVLGETTGRSALEAMRARMAADATGARLLAARPVITDATLQACWDCPPASFGAAYAQFMGARAFAPRDRPPVRFVDEAELAWVARRAREAHDLWHVLFACSTSVEGELRLKAVEAVQTGLPSAALAALVGPLRLPPASRRRLLQRGLPWALRAGSQAVDLMCVDYEAHLGEALDVVRARWHIIPYVPQSEAS